MQTHIAAKNFLYYTAERELKSAVEGAEIEVEDQYVDSWGEAGLIKPKKSKSKAELAAEAKVAEEAAKNK